LVVSQAIQPRHRWLSNSILHLLLSNSILHLRRSHSILSLLPYSSVLLQRKEAKGEKEEKEGRLISSVLYRQLHELQQSLAAVRI
jgi:hypothetical protein